MKRTLIVVVLLAAACGGGGGHKTSSASSSESASTVAAGAPTSAAPASGSPATTTGAAGGPATTAAASGPAATPAPVPPPTLAGPTNKPGSGAAQPTAPGTYKYRQSGSSTFGSQTKPVPPEGDLVVDPIQSNGDQVSHRRTDPNGPPSDQTFAFRQGGIFLVQLVMRSDVGGQTQTFTCNFNPPLPTPPWPPTVGSTYSGHADCGNFTIDVTGKVTATKDDAVQGASHHTFVLDSNLTFKGQLAGTGTQEDWVDPATSLILHEHATTKATYGNFVSFSSDTTSDIESTRPA